MVTILCALVSIFEFRVRSRASLVSLSEIKSGRIDGANLRGVGWARYGQRPAQHATLVHPCLAIGACEHHLIFLVRSQQVAKMPLAEENDMVKAIPSDRTDEPLRMSVLPWRSWCDRPVPNAHRANATDKDIAIDTIPIANDILRRLLPAVCPGELTRNPLGARMRGHAPPQNLTAGMTPEPQ